MKPNAPATYDAATVYALRALSEGVANEGQQKMALDWIVMKACRFYGMSFRLEDEGGDAGTAFHEGRRFVGFLISEMLTPERLTEVSKTKPTEAKTK